MRLTSIESVVRIEVVDDGIGGADIGAGSGLLGLADRIETVGGRFGVQSQAGGGTCIWAEVDLESD